LSQPAAVSTANTEKTAKRRVFMAQV
jgi:hypothetical protein